MLFISTIFSQGIQDGFLNCVYNQGGNYGVDSGRKSFWLIYWTIQQCWLCIYPGVMAWGMFGKIMKWQESALILAATIATGIAVLVKSLADNLYMDAPLYYYLACEHTTPITWLPVSTDHLPSLALHFLQSWLLGCL